MKLRLNFCIFILLSILNILACKHEPAPKECQYDSSVEEMKKWYYFKTGTWWVYQEQNTGVIDTVTVYYNWQGLSQSGYDGFEWKAISSLDGFLYHYSFNSSFSIYCLSSPECTCHKVERSRGQPGNFVGAGRIFLYPMIEGNYSGSGNGLTILQELDSSYSVGESVYYEVAKWLVQDDPSESHAQTEYRIAKNYGIIQHANFDANNNWILINSSIIQ